MSAKPFAHTQVTTKPSKSAHADVGITPPGVAPKSGKNSGTELPGSANTSKGLQPKTTKGK